MEFVGGYFFRNEIKYQLQTSGTLWNYFFVIIIVGSFIISNTFFFQSRNIHEIIPFLLLLILCIYITFSPNFFERESRFIMIDQLVVISSATTNLQKVYLARIFANAFLTLFPLTIIQLIVFIIQKAYLNLAGYYYIIFIIIFTIFNFFWILLLLEARLILTLKTSRNLLSNLLVLGGTIFSIGLIIITDHNTNLSCSYIVGLKLYNQLIFSLLVFSVGIVILIFSAALLTKTWAKLVTLSFQEKKKKELKGQSLIHNQITSFHDWKYLFKKKVTFYYFFILSIIFLMFTSQIFLNSEMNHLKNVIPMILIPYGLHFLFVYIFLLFFLIPRIVLEKQFNMEELIISRVSSFQYLKQRFALIFISLTVLSVTPLLILLFQSLIFSILFNELYTYFYVYLSCLTLVEILLVRIVYITSTTIFLWRILPSKNILKTLRTFIIGVEIAPIVISILFLPNVLVFAPVSSTIFWSIVIMIYPKLNSLIGYSMWGLTTLSLCFLFASYLLCKHEIRFE